MPNIRQTLAKISGLFDGIRQIHERYKVPRLKMTPLVRFSLLFLRIYLFLMITVLLYKFILITVFHH